ncbi:MAG: sensor histidine kinase [Bacteroidota bacterium]
MSVLNTFFLGRARIVTHLVSWILITFVIFNAVYIFRGPSEAVGRTLLNIGFIAMVFYVNSKVLVNFFYEKKRYAWWLGLFIILWLTMAALRTWSEIFIFGDTLMEQNMPGQRGQWRTFLMYIFMFFILLIFSSMYQIFENRIEVESRNRELVTMHNEARLNFLKAQINPHFLFNTLNNIYAAATLNHPATADMVLKLSEMLRYVTYDTLSERVPLSREMKTVQSVIELYIMCAQSPPDITVEMEGEVSTETIEPMLLLPIVENALKHGNMGDGAGTFMRVRISVHDDILNFEASNTYDPMNVQKDQTGGIGLANIRNRLRLHYPEKHKLTISIGRGIYTVSLKIEKNSIYE